MRPAQLQSPAKKTDILGPDLLPQECIPHGKLEGQLCFRSKVVDGTVCRDWLAFRRKIKGLRDQSDLKAREMLASLKRAVNGE